MVFVYAQPAGSWEQYAAPSQPYLQRINAHIHSGLCIMIAPSTPIDECLKDCTPAERAALDARTPPYDGVRTWGDLEAVRAQQTKKAKAE